MKDIVEEAFKSFVEPFNKAKRKKQKDFIFNELVSLYITSETFRKYQQKVLESFDPNWIEKDSNAEKLLGEVMDNKRKFMRKIGVWKTYEK